ncbi:MAG: hypothetical protein M1830_004818 [Pleopsidium flavum]|nr:MAG: hypothetical protein M1830_004818 [Pleopsidium flavum]
MATLEQKSFLWSFSSYKRKAIVSSGLKVQGSWFAIQEDVSPKPMRPRLMTTASYLMTTKMEV